MDNTKESPAVLSLCSGYGGIERGLERVFGKVSVLAHVEIEAWAIANLVDKMETGEMAPAPIWTDLKTFKAGIFRGMVDILTGGYPCQPFSAAGNRKGAEDPRHLWPYVREVIRQCEPRWVFFENVEGHISLGLPEVLSDLEEMAYHVECGVFSAAEVGAPHQRKRIFILGKLADDSSQRLQGWGGLVNQGAQWKAPQTIGYDSTGCHTQWPASTDKKLANGIRYRGLSGVPEQEQREERHPKKSNYDCYRWPTRENNISLQLWRDLNSTKFRGPLSEMSQDCQWKGDLWPARPGEPQHEWEEPRAVNSQSSKRRRSCNQDNHRGRTEKAGRPDGTHGSDGEIKSRLG